MAHVHFLTFGDGSPQIRGAAARLRREALQTGIFIDASVYHLKRIRDEYPIFWKKHGNFLLTVKRGLGYFLWKPFLISTRLNEIAENDFLVYADAGCEFMPDNRQELLDLLPTEPACDLSAVSLDSFHTNVRWTHGCCLAQLANVEEFLQQPMLAATFMFLRNTSRSRNLAAKWLEWSVYNDYCCLVDRPGDLERPEFEQHRHDQSIFSLLAYDLERQRAIGIKRIGVERTVDENAAILGTRNGTPFRSIGVNRYKRKILSKCYSAAVKFLWNENRYRADLYESGEKLLNPGSEGVLPPAEGVRFVDRALIAYGRGFEHPCKIRLVRGLVRGLAGGRVKVRHVGGTVIAIDPEDYIGWAIFRTGSYEPVSLARALKIMSAEPGLFVDVGANFGWYTCAVASIAGTNVIGIEPDPENCAALRANIDRNGLRTVAVFHGAVGAQPALLTMSRRSPGNSGTVAVAAGRPAPGSGGYLVGSTTLQELLNALVQPQARPVLIKIDVEGFEPEVLNGLDFAGPFRPKNILIECDRALGPAAWGSYQKFAAFFTQHGYEVLDVTGRPFTGDGPFLEENAWARDRDQAR